MSDIKISGMTAVTALTGAELAEVVQAAANKKVTIQKVLEFIAANLFIPYTVGTPPTPAFPTVPACAFDPTGNLPTLFWNTSTWQ